MDANHHGDIAVPHDTSVDAYRQQRDILRRLGGKARVSIMFQLTESVRAMTMAGIRKRHPEYDDDAVQLAYRRLVLGDELMQRVWPDCALVDP